jgi:hypothetical protein
VREIFENFLNAVERRVIAEYRTGLKNLESVST